MSSVHRGNSSGCIIKARIVEPTLPAYVPSLLFDLLKWKGNTRIAEGLSMATAKATARAWNTSKPAHDWVVLVPSAKGGNMMQRLRKSLPEGVAQ